MAGGGGDGEGTCSIKGIVGCEVGLGDFWLSLLGEVMLGFIDF